MNIHRVAMVQTESTMANTYTRLLYHCIWSTKGREPLIPQELEERIWSYLAGIAKSNKVHAIRIGGIENHIHALIDLPKTLTISTAMKSLKGGSTAWINDTKLIPFRFGWQDGYGAFSVSPSSVPTVVDYIANQREHHRHQTFEEEYRIFLERHGIDFDERYTFG